MYAGSTWAYYLLQLGLVMLWNTELDACSKLHGLTTRKLYCWVWRRKQRAEGTVDCTESQKLKVLRCSVLEATHTYLRIHTQTHTHTQYCRSSALEDSASLLSELMGPGIASYKTWGMI
jgi:hypothetical protein